MPPPTDRIGSLATTNMTTAPQPSLRDLRRRSTLSIPSDPTAQQFLAPSKDHAFTAYHHDDDIWDDDIPGSLRRFASHRPGRLPKDHLASVVDQRDKASPDHWIPRNPDLLRLTGKHPINAEPSPTSLLDQGFITPVSLHFVRNHGKSPRLSRDTHTLTVDGLVKNPMTFSMDDLLDLPRTTIPITICCSGNRRKELNMIKKTVGFNWSTSANSCNLWTGVKLSTLLEKCAVDLDKAHYVWLEGAKSEDLPNGTYGTSLDVFTASNPFDFVLVAWEQNGIPLSPDHGFPLRVVVPGYVGGRCVKWLEHITVTDRPSENFYHFHDNRVLPSHVDASLAAAEGWFYREQYLYNQLVIQSAIVYPAHHETMHAGERGMYTLKGYAFSGGGRKVTRVEVSLDDGESWQMCTLMYPEERYSSAPRHGKYYCWMFWEFVMDKRDIMLAAVRGGNIRCRAWDVSNNTQPSRITWNLLGMGNNTEFVVRMQVLEEFGTKMVQFIHPVSEGRTDTGWMKLPVPALALPEIEKATISKKKKPVKKYTMEEVEKHNTEGSVWIVVNNRVYDATKYLDDHPGGAESIMMNAGMDATEDFVAIHSEKATKRLEDFYIGDIGVASPTLQSPSVSSARVDLVALSSKEWREFELIERKEVSHDTRLFKFKLQSAQHRLGLPVGYHMFTQGVAADGKRVIRSYTPVSSDKELGTFTLCIKVYFKGVHAQFPDGGKMSQYMEGLKLGQSLKVKGPVGHFEYKGRGKLVSNGKEKTAKKLGMICGGTGLTPAYQVLQAIYNDPNDKTEIHLLYANKTVDDILMRKELDRMAAQRDNIFVWYTVNSAPADWQFSTGYVSKAMIGEHLPAPSDDVFVGMCGPPRMMSDCCVPHLTQLGHGLEQMVIF